MPIKKKKTTTKKTKTTAKKAKSATSRTKRTTTSRSKKKTTTKKTVAKKTKAKASTTKAKKKTVRKKSEPRKAAKASHTIHTRHSTPLRAKQEAPISTSQPSSGFSFQDALSQVRDRVHESEQPAVQSTKRATKLSFESSAAKKVLSPYVLDLKARKTVVSSHKVSLSPKKEEQPTLGLFEQEASKPFASMRSGWSRFVASLRPRKRINLIPRRESAPRPIGDSFARLRRRWSHKLTNLGDQLSQPYHSLQAKKRQQNFGLPTAKVKQYRVPLISKTTRSGQAIPVAQISKTLSKAKSAVSATQEKVLNLQDVLKRQPKPRAEFHFDFLSLQKAFIPFALTAFVLLLPFAGASLYQGLSQTQGEVLGATNLAVSHLQNATNHAKSFEFIQASKDFEEASQTFLAASALIENQQGLSTKALSYMPVVGKQVQTGKELLEIGTDLSEAATLFSQGIAVLADGNHFLSEEPLSYKLEYIFVRLEEAYPYLQNAMVGLAALDPEVIPEEMRQDIVLLQETLPELSVKLEEFIEMDASILQFLGHDSLERYLIVFQNNTELRATGGFMGSLALVDIDRAEIQSIEIPGGGPYDFQGSLYDFYESPRALQLINPRWELQDTNWFFDWPTSAQKVSRFYERAGGPSTDGVVALNTTVLEELLRFIGPVSLPDYEKEFTAENFIELLQNHVEFEYDQELNQPKKIIADLAPILLEEVKNLEPVEYLELAARLGELLQNKELFIYHTDEAIQSKFSQLGWTGEVVETESDYLGIVHTNLAGGKTDGVVQDTYDLETNFQEDGRIVHTLSITRTHNGPKGVPLIGVRNVDYMRVYVPKGSTLLSARGFEYPPQELFEAPGEDWKQDADLVASQGTYTVHEESGVEIYEELGKTVFAHWVQVDPGQSQTVQIQYEVPSSVLSEFLLPERESSWLDWITGETTHVEESVRAYQLYWQKQSGAWDPTMNISVTYPQEWQMEAFSDVQGSYGHSSWEAQATMNSDSLWNFLLY